MQHLCREYTMPRSENETRVRGWIRKNARIGPVLDMNVCHHEDRYNIEVQIPISVPRQNRILGLKREWCR